MANIVNITSTLALSKRINVEKKSSKFKMSYNLEIINPFPNFSGMKNQASKYLNLEGFAFYQRPIDSRGFVLTTKVKMAKKSLIGNCDYEKPLESNKCRVKIICLGDSAVGKSKLVERFLLDGFKPQTISTYALQLYNYETSVDNEPILVEFWDTAGQEMFQSMHPSFYHEAHCCILIFDSTRKITYKNLPIWLKELREYRPDIPVFCAANKIDANAEATQKSYAFPQKNNLPFYYVSASDGTNVVKLFKDAIKAAVDAKKNSTGVTDQILEELNRFQ